jgi:hypothetical protein
LRANFRASNLCVHQSIGLLLLLLLLPVLNIPCCRSDSSQKRYREAGIPWQGKALTDRARAASLAYARTYMSAAMQVSQPGVCILVLFHAFCMHICHVHCWPLVPIT